MRKKSQINKKIVNLHGKTVMLFRQELICQKPPIDRA